MSTVHRNIRQHKYCPKCEHFHRQPNTNQPDALGMCLLNPPTPFVIGMASPAVVAKPDASNQAIPIIRAYFPPVGSGDTCGQWMQRSEGEA